MEMLDRIRSLGSSFRELNADLAIAPEYARCVQGGRSLGCGGQEFNSKTLAQTRTEFFVCLWIKAPRGSREGHGVFVFVPSI